MELNNNSNVNNTVKVDKLFKLATVLFLLGAIGLMLSILFIMSFLFILLYYLILIVVMFMSLFALMDKLRPLFEKGQEIQELIISTHVAIPYILVTSIIFSLISLNIFILKKDHKDRMPKIIASSFILIISLIFLIVKFLIIKN